MSLLMTIVYLVSIIGMVSIATITATGSIGIKKYYFSATIYLAAIWLALQYIVQVFELGDTPALYIIRTTSFIALAISISFYLFIRSYINSINISKIPYICVALVTIGTILNFFTNMITGARGSNDGIVVSSSYLYTIYMAVIALIFILSFYDLLKFNLKIKTKLDKKKNKIMMYGILQAVVLVLTSSFLQSFAESQVLIPIGLLIMTIVIGFAMTIYQLFDIKSAAIRTFAYILSLLTLSALYYGLAYVLSNFLLRDNMSISTMFSVSPINIILALLLTLIFQPIKGFFDKITNEIFYKDNYNTDEFFAKLNRTLSSTSDLRGLLERTANEIAKTLKSEQAFFFIHTANGQFITAGTDHYTKMPRADALELQIVHEMNYGLFIASLRDEDDPVRRLMVSHGIEMILPLKQASIIGYLCLGNHMTSNYTSRDIKVLNTIADELVIAIQNALAVQEIREFNVTLQQRINNATRELRTSNMMLRKLDKIKDEFVSIASHQLRTPLTSVKGYISMILDGDAGDITSAQRELLSEAYISSERMVHLISDFLNVSRLQTGKFIIDKKPTDLSKVVGEEIDSLRPSAASRNMEFIYNSPKDFPLLDLDEGKIRQVIMNFADNSIYYSEEGTKIKIDLSVEGNEVLFTVKDTGIGVPKSEQAQLFTKFYRASNAKSKRPDGTGVGLFLAKKVIDAHHGQVVFESTEGKGSTFGFRLPIAENKPTSLELAERSQQS